MRKAIFLLAFLFPLFSLAQSGPFTYKISTKKTGDTTYLISLNGTIAEDWHLYGEDNPATGIESPKFSWDAENIHAHGVIKSNMKSVAIKDPIFENADINVYKGDVQLQQEIGITGTIPARLKITLHGFIANDQEFLPVDSALTVSLEGGVTADASNKIKLVTVDLNHPAAPCGDSTENSGKGLWTLFLLGLGGGLIALLTPCVFPMIPVTVSFFTGRASNKRQGIRNGILYGFFIILIYLAASLPFHLIGGINPEIFNTISTNAWVNLVFFAVFIFFALSFFGFFEITLPSGAATKVDSKSGLGSIGGIFFMALTLAIVSFSCTGPILGSLLVGSLSSSGGAWQLTAGMGGFGVALALPFALFAIFPNLLKALPRSGGWLDTVKKVLAFLELALAFKFLSNADLVMNWGILKREVFIGIWLLIALSLALYLFGIIRLPHDYKGQKISTARRVWGVLFLALAVYLVPGVTNTQYANLKLLSGFPPPLSYSVYGKSNIHGKGVEPRFINDYEKALALAKAQGKPLLIDFTGWACVNCRKMEEQVWTKPEIATLINDQYILVSLYVDDRKKLPAQAQFTYKDSKGTEKDIVTSGDMWATFQAENFNKVSQPLYIALSPDEKLLTHPVAYTPDVKEYKEWLQCGLNANKKTAVSLNR